MIKKTDRNAKINEIVKKITDCDHGKYNATQEFNKLTAGHFAAKTKQGQYIRQ